MNMGSQNRKKALVARQQFARTGEDRRAFIDLVDPRERFRGFSYVQ